MISLIEAAKELGIYQPSDLRTYLLSCGWDLVHENPVYVLYEKGDEEIHMPVNDELFRDWNLRANQALHTLVRVGDLKVGLTFQ